MFERIFQRLIFINYKLIDSMIIWTDIIKLLKRQDFKILVRHQTSIDDAKEIGVVAWTAFELESENC